MRSDPFQIQANLNAKEGYRWSTEHRQPAMLRVRMTRENDDDGTNNGQRQGGRVARGGVVRRAGD